MRQTPVLLSPLLTYKPILLPIGQSVCLPTQASSSEHYKTLIYHISSQSNNVYHLALPSAKKDFHSQAESMKCIPQMSLKQTDSALFQTLVETPNTWHYISAFSPITNSIGRASGMTRGGQKDEGGIEASIVIQKEL